MVYRRNEKSHYFQLLLYNLNNDVCQSGRFKNRKRDFLKKKRTCKGRRDGKQA